MYALVHSETFWLQLTNFALAVGCVVSMSVLAVAVIRDLVTRRHRLAQIVRLDEGATDVSKLGPTMADGGLPYTGDTEAVTRP